MDSVPDNDLLPLLRKRLLGLYSPLLADTTATILFTAGGLATWTVDDRPRPHLGAGAAVRPRRPRPCARPCRCSSTSCRAGAAASRRSSPATSPCAAISRWHCSWTGCFPAIRPTTSRTLHPVGAAPTGIETFYLESGPHDAPPVVLVHGLSATNASMLPLIPPLARKLPGARAGPARSRRHRGDRTSAHGAAYLGEWLAAFLRETCDRPAVLVGNSLGGRTALQAALDSPDAVRGLVLLCPAVAFRKLRQFVPFVRLVPDEVAALPVRVPRGLATRGLRSLFADPTRLPPSWYDAAIDEFARVLSIRANRLAIFSALRHVYLDEPFGDSGFWDRLPDLKPPGAVPVGRPGRARAGRRSAAWCHEALPSARSIVLDDCGHVPQFEHPELTVQYTMEFIESSRPDASSLSGGGVSGGAASAGGAHVPSRGGRCPTPHPLRTRRT